MRKEDNSFLIFVWFYLFSSFLTFSYRSLRFYAIFFHRLVHKATAPVLFSYKLAACAKKHSGECRKTDADETAACIKSEIAKRRFTFRLISPYRDDRRRAASEKAKIHSNSLLRLISKV